MIVEIEGKQYQVHNNTIDTVFDQIEQFTLEQYAKLPDVAKIAGQAATRTILAFAEKNEKDKEKRKMFKPERKADPTVHILHLLIGYIKVGVKQIYGRIDTHEQFITGIQIQSTSRGLISPDGNTGKWQDDNGEDARQYAIEDLSVS